MILSLNTQQRALNYYHRGKRWVVTELAILTQLGMQWQLINKKETLEKKREEVRKHHYIASLRFTLHLQQGHGEELLPCLEETMEELEMIQGGAKLLSGFQAGHN